MADDRRGAGRPRQDQALDVIGTLTEQSHRDPSPIEIARALGIDRRQLHPIIKKFEDGGLVERRSRGNAVHMTDAGWTARARLHTEIDPQRQALRERITEAVRALQGNGDPVRREAIVLRVLAQQVPDIEREIEAMVQDGSLMHANGEYTLPDEQK